MAERLFETSQMSGPDIFRLMLGFIGPRPIGWISTISEKGVFNLAPFSFFNMLGNNPATLVYSPAISREGRHKDSLLNAQKTHCFVHNVVTREIAEVMNKTSEEFPYGVSEFEKSGLTPLPSKFIKAPRVKEAAINVECEVIQVLSLGDKPGNGQLVFGKVLAIHVNDDRVLNEKGFIDSSQLELVARLGGDEYTSVNEASIFRLPHIR